MRTTTSRFYVVNVAVTGRLCNQYKLYFQYIRHYIWDNISVGVWIRRKDETYGNIMCKNGLGILHIFVTITIIGDKCQYELTHNQGCTNSMGGQCELSDHTTIKQILK